MRCWLPPSSDTDLVSRGQQARGRRSHRAQRPGNHAALLLDADENLVWPYVKGWKANAMDKHRSRWISIDQRRALQLFA